MRDAVRRWALILLPIVIVVRVLLLVFQIGSEHEARQQADETPAWAPLSGEVLSFRPREPGRHRWARDEDWRPFVAVSATKNGTVQPSDTACLLALDVMSRSPGRLVLRHRTSSGTWEADWLNIRAVLPGEAQR